MANWTGSATSSGGTMTYIHVKATVERTDSNTSSAIKVYCYAVSGTGSSSYIRGRATNYDDTDYSDGNYGAQSGDTYVGTGQTVLCQTGSFSVNRGTSNRTIRCWARLDGYGTGMYNGTYDWVYVDVTIPALSSYIVSYNANGGSGAPANQTKYYGQDLTLSTTIPTRSGYSFKGWATSSTSTTVAYNSGGKYTGNATLALYAVWSLDYIEPTIGSVEAIRCDSAQNPSEDGTYAKVIVIWNTDTNYAGSSLKFEYKLSSNTTYTSVGTDTLSGSSGTTEKLINGNFDPNKTYGFRVTLTDTHDSSVISYGAIPVKFKTLSLLAGGTGLAIGKTAAVSNKIETTLPIKIQFLNITDNVTPSENIYNKEGVKFLDSNNSLLGWIGYASRTTSAMGSRIYACRNEHYNGINFNILSDGTPEIGFEDNASKLAWLKALQPDILFNGDKRPGADDSTGIQLSASSINYNHMRIYYKCNDSRVPEASVEVYEPDGKYVNLFIGYAGYGSGLYWPQATDIFIDGSIIKRRYSFTTSNSTTTVRTTAAGSDTSGIRILRVEAWNDEWWG